MAQEIQAPAAPATAAEVVVAEMEPVKGSTPAPEPVEEKEKKEGADVDVRAGDDGVEASDKSKETVIPQSASFKEESNVVADLSEHEKKALDELKELIVAALANNEFTRPPPPPPPVKEEKKEEVGEKKEEEKKEEVVGEKKEEEKKVEVVGEQKEEEKKEEVVIVEKQEEPKESKKEEVEQTKKGEEPVKPEACAPATEEKPAPSAAAEGKKEADDAAKTVEAIETKKGKEPMKLEPCAPAKEEKPAPAAVAEEKKGVDDGAKTVEAIEKTVVQATVAATAEIVKEEGKKPEVAEVVEEDKPKPKPHETGEEAGEEEKEKIPAPPPEEVFVWGVPLLGSEKSDTILLKFLRARDFRVKDALTMIKNTVIWRKEFAIEALLEEDLGLPELEKVVFMRGVDKERHPLWYNVFGEFQDKEMYQKSFGDVQKRKIFLKWMVQLLEKEIREKLDFTPEGVCTIVQVNDLKNSPLLWKKELRQTTVQAVHLLQDNYPEFAAKQVFINVPWWFLPFIRMIAPFFTLRSKSKFVYAGPSKSAETLFKYIAPEQVPVQYGGLSMEGDTEFCTADPVTLVSIKPASKHTVQIPVTEGCVLVWELRVLAWDVSYGVEFVPDAEGGYAVIVQKMRKFVSTDEAVEKNSFKIGEPGKVVFTIDNATSKKKKLLYRYKTESKTD